MTTPGGPSHFRQSSFHGIAHYFPARTRTGIAAAASGAKATLTTRVWAPAWRSVRHIAARRTVIRFWLFMAGSFPCGHRSFGTSNQTPRPAGSWPRTRPGRQIKLTCAGTCPSLPRPNSRGKALRRCGCRGCCAQRASPPAGRLCRPRHQRVWH